MHAVSRAVLILMLLGVAVSTATAADKVTTIPVHFAKGASSATLKGSFSGYDSVRYTVAARAGQTMTVKITGSTNANFNILPPGAIPGETSAIGSGHVGGDWSDTLPTDGTYVVEVYQMRASARRGEKASYTIDISITGAPADAQHGAAAGPSPS